MPVGVSLDSGLCSAEIGEARLAGDDDQVGDRTASSASAISRPWCGGCSTAQHELVQARLEAVQYPITCRESLPAFVWNNFPIKKIPIQLGVIFALFLLLLTDTYTRLHEKIGDCVEYSLQEPSPTQYSTGIMEI